MYSNTSVSLFNSGFGASTNVLYCIKYCCVVLEQILDIKERTDTWTIPSVFCKYTKITNSIQFLRQLSSKLTGKITVWTTTTNCCWLSFIRQLQRQTAQQITLTTDNMKLISLAIKLTGITFARLWVTRHFLFWSSHCDSQQHRIIENGLQIDFTQWISSNQNIYFYTIPTVQRLTNKHQCTKHEGNKKLAILTNVTRQLIKF